MIASVPVNPYMKHTNTEYSDNVNSGIHIESENRSRNHSVTPGILISGVVDFDKRNSLGVEAEYKFGDKHDRTSSGSILYDKDAEIPTRGFYNRRERNHDIDTRMNYTRYIDSKNSYMKIIGGFSYRDYTTDEDNEVVKEIGDSVYNVAMSSDVTNANLEVRLFKKFSKSWSLSAGVKHTYNHIYNGTYHTYDKHNEWIADTRYDYDADYDENITALYVSVPGKIGNFSLRAGLRGELYKTSSVGLNRSDFGLFPSLSVTYPLTKKGDYNVNAVYSRKTKRPTFWQQSPLVRQFSDYILYCGKYGSCLINHKFNHTQLYPCEKFHSGRWIYIYRQSHPSVFRNKSGIPGEVISHLCQFRS